MGILFVYIIKSSVCLSSFYLFYKLLLSKETFHRFNRIALLGILLLSSLLPFIEVTMGGQTEVQQTVLTIEQLLMMAGNMDVIPTQGIPHTQSEFPVLQFLLLVYYLGIMFFMFRQFYSLSRLLILIHSGKRQKLAKEKLAGYSKGVTIIIHEQAIAPCSWMKFVVISRKDFEDNGREILIHEMAHIRHRHSWDLLVADICIIFQWFNPGAWLLKQELQNIHEYEADESVLKEGVNAKEYQLLLIKKAVGTRLYSMANSFNHSKLKKRITMMLKEKSNPWACLKYLYVLPLATLAVSAFARPEISVTVEEISAVKVKDLASIVEAKVGENVTRVPSLSAESKVTPENPQALVGDSVIVTPKLRAATTITKVSAKDKPLTFVLGKEADSAVVNALNPEYIKRVTVLKGKQAVEKYGEKGKNGVIEIDLYSAEELTAANQQSLKKRMEDTVIVVGYTKRHVAKKELRSGMQENGKKAEDSVIYGVREGQEPLIIVNGKEMSQAGLAAIAPDRIESVSVLKNESATAVYGEKGKNGVVMVTLKSIDEMKKDSVEGEKTFRMGTDKYPSESIQVEGVVKDSKGKAVAGASVVVKGTTTGTVTDKEGKFSLETPKNSVIKIVYMDMVPIEVEATVPELHVVLQDKPKN